MVDRPHDLERFFSIAVNALRREDLFVRRYLSPYREGAYREWSPGIGALYETSLVYLILRELWAAGFPNALTWEIGYPGWAQAKLDLGVYAAEPTTVVRTDAPTHAIEVKRWLGNGIDEQLAVWSDILKLLWFNLAERRYVLLLSFGPPGQMGADVKALCAMQLGGRHLEQWDLERIMAKLNVPEPSRKHHRLNFQCATEVLADEFETVTFHLPNGAVRVSLIEVLAKGPIVFES